MQYPVTVRFNRQLRDDVGIPPESRTVVKGEVVKVLSGHASWLEERGFAERVQECSLYKQGVADTDLSVFVARLEEKMQGPYPNKMTAPAEVQKQKRGRPKGSKNRPKK